MQDFVKLICQRLARLFRHNQLGLQPGNGFLPVAICSASLENASRCRESSWTTASEART